MGVKCLACNSTLLARNRCFLCGSDQGAVTMLLSKGIDISELTKISPRGTYSNSDIISQSSEESYPVPITWDVAEKTLEALRLTHDKPN